MAWTSPILVLFAAVATFAVVSCGESDEARTARERALTARLADKYFVSTRVEGDPRIEGAKIQIDFIGGFDVYDGCNNLSGELVVEDSDKVRSKDGGRTLAGCADEELEAFLGEILEEGLHASLIGDRLQLRNGRVRIELVRQSPPPGLLEPAATPSR